MIRKLTASIIVLILAFACSTLFLTPVGSQQVQGRIVVATGVQGTGSSTNNDIPTMAGAAGNSIQDPAACTLTSSALNCLTGLQISLNNDTFFTRPAAATWQLGQANAAVPVAQTFQAQGSRGGTDTNVAGGPLTVEPGTGTGNATPSTLTIKGPAAGGASGSTAETQTIRVVINDTKALTSGSAVTVLSIPLATLQMGAGQIVYVLEATDGTNNCTRSGTITYAGENSAGVFVATPSAAAGSNENVACTAASTLTDTWTLTGANPALLQVTATTSMAATRFTIIYEVHHMGQTQPTP